VGKGIGKQWGAAKKNTVAKPKLHSIPKVKFKKTKANLVKIGATRGTAYTYWKKTGWRRDDLPPTFPQKLFEPAIDNPAHGDRYNRNTFQLVRATGATESLAERVAAMKGPKFGRMYARRARTSFGLTSGLNRQGPHTFPHIGKRTAVEMGHASNKGFSIGNIPVGTGLLPTAGQNRRLLRAYEEENGVAILPQHKRALDKAYRNALMKREAAATQEEREGSTAKAMEMNVLATYGHGTIPTAAEMKGKGESRSGSVAGILEMLKMGASVDPAKLAMYDQNAAKRYSKRRMRKYLKDTASMAVGDDEHSAAEFTSDEEYDSDDD